MIFDENIKKRGVSMLDKLLRYIRKKEGNVPIKTTLDDMLQASHLSNEKKFNNILKFANRILNDKSVSNSKEHPIFDFIRVLGRGLQSNYMKYLMYYDCEDDSHNIPDLYWNSIGFDIKENFVGDNGEIIKFYDLKKEVKCSQKLNLSTDLILPWPWKKSRLVNTITKIGEGRVWGEWKQDYANHYVEVWLPMGIAWVNGGNHSIAVGIIQGGQLIPDHYYEISEVYKHVKCDGKNFIRTRTSFIIDNQILAPVTNIEFAAIFEIGRLLVEKGISFVH